MEPNRYRVSARLSLEGVGRDFSQEVDKLVHLQLGSYVLNSGITPVISRSVHGQRVVLRLGGEDSFIRATFSYDNARSLLDIDLDADRINLPDLSYLLQNADGPVANNPVALSFGLFPGSRYYANATLDGDVIANKENIVIQLHAEK